MKIQVLPQNVVSQIAAGEVVQRPAHLLKELVENSLDAGARVVEVEFADRGRFIRVTDDGMGMTCEEVPRALWPHSTSKITCFEDLWNLKSYGFRGEALSSIAQVSDLTLISKKEGEDQATRLHRVFGEGGDAHNTTAPQGTTVVVQNLFETLPARLKFLKSEASESTAIKNVLKAFALSHPQVRFRVLHKGKLLFYWEKSKNMEERFKQVCSVKGTFYTRTKYHRMEVEAVMCAPNEVARTRRGMWFFVEKRWVEDSTLFSAVMTAYRGLLMHGEYPLVALNVGLPPGEVDVNIHPSKSQVKFKNSREVFSAVSHSVRAVLEKAPWIPRTGGALPANQKREGFDFSREASVIPRDAGTTPFTKNPVNQQILSTGEAGGGELSFSSALRRVQFPKKSGVPFAGGRFPTPQALKNLRPPGAAAGGSDEGHVTFASKQKEGTVGYWSSLDILCQAGLTYLITQSQTALVFIDQHAAHERVLYEKLMQFWNQGSASDKTGKKQDRGSKTPPLEIQNRLIPLVLDLGASAVEALMSVKEDLLRLGIRVECSGVQTLVIESAPCILKDMGLQKALVHLAEDIQSKGGGFSLQGALSEVCATMACHSAIRAGQAMSAGQMQSLLEQMDQYPLSSFCPHGRPVFVDYPFSRLEKDFGRRV